MNTLSLAALPLVAATLLSTQTPAPIASTTEEEFEPVSVASEPVRIGAGLGPRRVLQTGTLQMGTGLQSGARGLTPESEWRTLFPVKPGTR